MYHCESILVTLRIVICLGSVKTSRVHSTFVDNSLSRFPKAQSFALSIASSMERMIE